MSRTIITLCWVYASKREIFQEWTFGMVEGSLAVGKMYIKPKEMIEHYEFKLSKNGKCYIK